MVHERFHLSPAPQRLVLRDGAGARRTWAADLLPKDVARTLAEGPDAVRARFGLAFESVGLDAFARTLGERVPEGFDRARDVLELAQRFKIVNGTSWLSWGDKKWQGEHNAVVKLTGDPDLLDELEMEVRAKFEAVAPVEITEDGEIT